MKLFFAITLLVLSFTVSARQYVQCGEDGTSSNYIVINLDGEKSTLFLTRGADLPETESNRFLFKIQKKREDSEFLYYVTIDKSEPIKIHFPKAFLNVASSNFLVQLELENELFNYHCFSALYPSYFLTK